VVIARSGSGLMENFTVRKISYGEGVERVFPVLSPNIDRIEVLKRGKVRRAKLYYLRDRRGKSARIFENQGARTRKIEQTEREAALEDFKAGKTTVLVATDVASRGLDIESLPQVINFDVPHSPEDYVHRIGRTGRAGMTGEAISLVAPEDQEALAAIERLIKKKIERVLVAGFEPNAGTVATLMGGQPSKPRKTSQPSDPIFSKPYEPASAPTEKQPDPARPKRRQPQVAALLGGRKTG
jgi:hypothetical protein